jgi:uncharacterized protein Yka (UPF0111/DUF47 family)
MNGENRRDDFLEKSGSICSQLHSLLDEQLELISKRQNHLLSLNEEISTLECERDRLKGTKLRIFNN